MAAGYHHSREVTRYPSPGQCIYCGRVGVKLTNEHIIPLAIDGFDYIEEASCGWCQKITCKLEDYIARRQFDGARLLYESRSRRTRRNRPTHLEQEFRVGGRLVSIPLPTPAHSTPWGMLYTDHPRLLTGKPLRHHLEYQWVNIWRVPQGGPTSATKVKIYTWQGVSRYLRFLAKVAHCAAVANFGLESFDPFLTDMITTKEEDHVVQEGSKFVGCVPGHHLAHPHHGHIITPIALHHEGDWLAAIHLRLFVASGNPGTPHYLILAGRLRNPKQSLDKAMLVEHDFDALTVKLPLLWF